MYLHKGWIYLQSINARAYCAFSSQMLNWLQIFNEQHWENRFAKLHHNRHIFSRNIKRTFVAFITNDNHQPTILSYSIERTVAKVQLFAWDF